MTPSLNSIAVLNGITRSALSYRVYTKKMSLDDAVIDAIICKKNYDMSARNRKMAFKNTDKKYECSPCKRCGGTVKYTKTYDCVGCRN